MKPWELNVISTDPSDPEGLDGKTYGMVTGGRTIRVGDSVEGGVVEGFVDRGVRILPDEGPAYTRYMGRHQPRPPSPLPDLTKRARMREDAAERAYEQHATRIFEPPSEFKPSQEELDDIEFGTYLDGLPESERALDEEFGKIPQDYMYEPK